MNAIKARLPLDAFAEIPDSIERWLSPRQASEITGLSEKWLAAAREGRKGVEGPPFKKIGAGRTAPVRYPLHSLREWMTSFNAFIDNAGRKSSICSSFTEFCRSNSPDATWLFALDLENLSYAEFVAAVNSQTWTPKLLLRWLTIAEYKSGAVFPVTTYVTATEFRQRVPRPY